MANHRVGCHISSLLTLQVFIHEFYIILEELTQDIEVLPSKKAPILRHGKKAG